MIPPCLKTRTTPVERGGWVSLLAAYALAPGARAMAAIFPVAQRVHGLNPRIFISDHECDGIKSMHPQKKYEKKRPRLLAVRQVPS